MSTDADAGFDVAIVGAGPAGAIAAHQLARAGWRVLVLDGGAPRVHAGETLPGSARLALERAGLWDGFARDAHPACHTARAIWGGEVRELDHLRDPYGPAHFVDRARFDASLRAAAAAAGAVIHTGSAKVARAARGFTVRAGDHAWTATIAVDAGGRGARVARALGARRRSVDALTCAFVRWVDPACAVAAGTYIEPVEHGYWYRSVDPTGAVTVALFSDADLIAGSHGHAPGAWLASYRRTAGARELPIADASGLQVRAASVGRLDRAIGPGWLAIGDAALTQDPLSSRGIVAALTSGLHAAATLIALRHGARDAAGRYADTLRAVHAKHLADRRTTYRTETRWPDAPFWRRRTEEARADA